MAATPPLSAVLQALVACGVRNTQMFNGHTPVWHLLDELFIDNFESCTDKTPKELENDFKSYINLSQV